MSQPISSSSALAEALRGWPPPVLDPQGPVSSSISTLAWVLLATCVLGVVAAPALVWALAFRMQPHRDVLIIRNRTPQMDPSAAPPGTSWPLADPIRVAVPAPLQVTAAPPEVRAVVGALSV